MKSLRILYAFPLAIVVLLMPITSNASGEVQGYRVLACVDEQTGDTIPNILLSPVYVFPKLVFKNTKEEKFYWKTVRDVKKMLPYAKMVSKLLVELDSTMATMKTDRERKKFMEQK